MGSPVCLANMLLTALVFVPWMAWLTCANMDGNYLVDYKGAPFDTRPQVDNTLNLAKELITKKNIQKVAGLIKGISNFAKVVPIIGPLFASISAFMVFLPQHDPVLKAVTDGFREVNRKLDSLSLQVSNLATDVEWYNYASVYSQDEVRILSAWNKYEQFFQNHSAHDIKNLANIFVSYYENMQVEGSVFNLYHYLTVTDTSLSANLNNLLRKKFKCDLKKILNYNIYFSSLLMKGIGLNTVYWYLIKYNITDKDEEHTQMLKNVFAAQLETVDHCLNNHTEDMKDDVVEVAKSVSSDNLQAIADKVKGFLDDKYDFYKWVVLVYKKDKETGSFKYIVVYDDIMTKIPINNELIVAVAYTQRAYIPEARLAKLEVALKTCPHTGLCGGCLMRNESIRYDNEAGVYTINVVDYAKKTHALYNGHESKLNPGSNTTLRCLEINDYTYDTAIYYSRTLSPCDGPDPQIKCKNNGTCERLLDTNDALCKCQDGFYGDTCENNVGERHVPMPKGPLTVKTTGVQLANIESKLENIESKLENIESKLKEILHKLQ